MIALNSSYIYRRQLLIAGRRPRLADLIMARGDFQRRFRHDHDNRDKDRSKLTYLPPLLLDFWPGAATRSSRPPFRSGERPHYDDNTNRRLKRKRKKKEKSKKKGRLKQMNYLRYNGNQKEDMTRLKKKERKKIKYVKLKNTIEGAPRGCKTVPPSRTHPFLFPLSPPPSSPVYSPHRLHLPFASQRVVYSRTKIKICVLLPSH